MSGLERASSQTEVVKSIQRWTPEEVRGLGASRRSPTLSHEVSARVRGAMSCIVRISLASVSFESTEGESFNEEAEEEEALDEVILPLRKRLDGIGLEMGKGD